MSLLTAAATFNLEPRKPVRAFPSILHAKTGDPRGQPVVQWSFAQAATSFKFTIGPGHLVVQTENLRDALTQKGAVVRPRSETANVHRPKVNRGLSFDDPFGKIFSRSAGARDADGVEAGGDEQISQFRRLAQDEVVVGRETLRPVDEPGELAGFQRGDAPLAVLERLRKFFPVRLQELKREIVRHTLEPPRFGKGLERAEHDRVALATEINAQIGVPTDRQFVKSAVDRPGDDVVMFHRVKRNRDTATQTEFARPHAAGEHDVFRFDLNCSSRGNEALIFVSRFTFRARG